MTQIVQRTFAALTLAGLMAAPWAAAAQESGETETPSETTAEAPAPNTDPATGLNMGTEEAQPGDVYIKEVHGDWELRCTRTESGKDPCQLYQLLKDETGNSVAEINLFNLRGDGQAVAGASIVTPLETLLTQQIGLSVDGGPVKRYPFTVCARIGCISRVGFSAADIDAFRAGSAANVAIVPAAAPDQKVNLKASLTGFTAGFKAMKEHNDVVFASEAPAEGDGN